MKKIFSCFLSVLIGIGCIDFMHISAAEAAPYARYSTGLIRETEEEIIEKTGCEVIDASDYHVRTTGSLPVSYDVTTGPKYFPPIDTQGDMGSCTAWATTYYQFTYELNRYLGEQIIDGDETRICSPTWTYNYGNGGCNVGLGISDAYNILNRQGVMMLSDLPYDEDIEDYSFDWPTDKNKLIDALKYRSKMTQISGITSSNLNIIKQRLADGQIPTIGTNSGGWETANITGQKSHGETIIVRGSNADGGHMMTIVGYDDEIEVEVNGVTLVGAFKLANSWGAGWENSGYIWVAYDALNAISAHGSTWQNGYTKVREPVFWGNSFYFIEIFECDVNFAGIVRFYTQDPWSVTLMGNSGTYAVSTKWEYTDVEQVIYPSKQMRYLAFDFSQTGSTINLNSMLSGNLATRLTSSTTYQTHLINTIVYDNLGNEIVGREEVSGSLVNGSYQRVMPIRLRRGRVTAYDNTEITSADSEMVLNYLVENTELSSLQLFLADYLVDGVVNIQDVIAMNQYISAQNGETYMITDYIEEWGCSLADVIEREYGMSLGEYAAQNYDELSAMNVLPETIRREAYAYQ